MAGQIPELVIPVRFDVGKVPGNLAKVGAAGKQASGDVTKGFRTAGAALDKAGMSMTSFVRAQIGLAAVKSTMTAIAGEFNKTEETLMRMAKEFIKLRQGMQEVATLRGEVNSNKFTLAEAKTAAAFSMLPEERRSIQSGFLNFAGAQVGPQPGAKLNSAQADDFSMRMGLLMKAAGYAPGAAMTLGGSILQQKTGPQDVEKLIKEFSVAFQVMEKGQVDIATAAPQISELMAMGMSAKEAALSYSVISPAAPGKELATVEGAFRAMEEMKVEGKEGLFGVNNKMTPYESLKAFGVNISERLTANQAAGMTEEEAKTQVAKDMKQAGVAADIRERRGVISGAARSGTLLGGFGRFEAIAAGTSPAFERLRREAYEESQPGQYAKSEALHAEAEAIQGEKDAEIVKRRMEARTRLLKAGRIARPTRNDLIMGAIPDFGTGALADMEHQQINREMIAQAQREAGIPVETGLGINDRTATVRTQQILEAIRKSNEAMARPGVLSAPPRPADGARNNN